MGNGVKNEEVLKAIGRVVREEAERLGVEVERVILFGSRARGEQRGDSDWDILVVVKEIEWRKKMQFYGRVHRRLVGLLGGSVDLLVVPDRWFWENVREDVSFEAEVVETGTEIPV